MLEKSGNIQNKEVVMPVFKSDTMETDELVHPVGSMSPVADMSPVSMSGTTFDSIAAWRYMSEKYRDQRLLREKQQQEPLKNIQVSTVDLNKNYQSNYELDNSNFSSQKDNIPWHDYMLKNIWQAQLPIDLETIETPEDEDYNHPDDGMPRITDVMSKDVISVIDSTTIEQVVNIFNKHKIHCVPVINYQNKYLMGIITSTDILSHIFDHKSISTFNTIGSTFTQESLTILDKPVKEFMQRNVIQVPVNCTVKEACKLMFENKIHRIVITKNQRVKGIFSASDTVKILADL